MYIMKTGGSEASAIRMLEMVSEPPFFGDGYDASLFGKIVKIAGAEYRVVGVNTRSRKQPIKLERVSDKRDFKCNVLALRAIA